MTKDEELRKLLDMIYELPNAIAADYETGSHERNNHAATVWLESNRFLDKALDALTKYAQSIDPS